MAFSIILALFVALPIVELAILFRMAEWMGFLHTVLLVILTGVVGASLARWQGLQILFQIQRDLAEGRMPAPLLIDGLMIIIAGALLITPGLITDTVGFLLLVPYFRSLVKTRVRRYFESRVQSHVIDVTYSE